MTFWACWLAHDKSNLCTGQWGNLERQKPFTGSYNSLSVCRRSPCDELLAILALRKLLKHVQRNCCKCRLSIFTSIFLLKKQTIDEKVQFLVMIFGQKLAFWSLLPNERGYEVKIGSCCWFLCLHNCKIYDLVL